MTHFNDRYRNRRVLLTGHTGFKGSWLALWLNELGAQVSCVSLPPESIPNHWDLLQLVCDEHRQDLRDYQALAAVVAQTQPEIVFHLAAQALVRRSYANPLETWSTNVIGTANLLEACRHTPSVRAIVVITSDKCYDNQEWPWGYRETDPLGGHDPYSASKGATELVAASYRKSFFGGQGAPLLATARAGNVIGGGDWAQDRLIPDLVRSVSNHSPLEIRSPLATRPWQHVLESLSGYLLLGQNLLENRHQFADAWNFGPDPDSNRSVAEVLTRMRELWPAFEWFITAKPQPHEANLLYLDSSKAKAQLNWTPVWDLEATLAITAGWYRSFLESGLVASRAQLAQYQADAKARNAVWCGA